MKIGFLSILTLIFITLKLTHIIDWDWIYVLMPTIVGICVLSIWLIIAVIIVSKSK